jgi:hypothetical protein
VRPPPAGPVTWTQHRRDLKKMNGRLKPQSHSFDTGAFQTKPAGRELSFSVAMNRVEPSLQDANDFHAATAKLEKFTAQHFDCSHQTGY